RLRVDGGGEAGVDRVVPLPAPARDHQAPSGDLAGMDGPDGGRGEGEEHPRVGDDRLRDVLGVVAGQASPEQVVGVGGVAVGAGGADRGPPVPAGGEDGAGAFEQDGAVPVEDLGGAGQVD